MYLTRLNTLIAEDKVIKNIIYFLQLKNTTKTEYQNEQIAPKNSKQQVSYANPGFCLT